MEGAATTVYAQGGRGNARLVAWEGERTVTFTMEDALISPEGLAILSGAGLIAATEGKPIYQHTTEIVDKATVLAAEGSSIEDFNLVIPLKEVPYIPTDLDGNFAYVMFMKDGEIISEPYIPKHIDGNEAKELIVCDHDMYNKSTSADDLEEGNHAYDEGDEPYDVKAFPQAYEFDSVFVDYYVARTGGASQMEITADKFGGQFYVEASTLFRDTNGVDMPAEFIIPSAKIQSNFTFTMAASGDPSTFTFTMDAFPDYTRFDHTHKVLAAIQIIEYLANADLHRHSTVHQSSHDTLEW